MESFIKIKQIKCLEGLHYSFDLLQFNYNNLYEKCISIQSNPENLMSALTQCWFIADLVHRIREISQVIGLSQADPNLKNFLNKTKIAEDYRHYIQHLRQELTKRDLNLFPVWGTLSWVDPVDSNNTYIAVVGSRIKNTKYPSCTYDTKNRKWVSKVCLSIDNISFDFDHIYEVTMTFKDFIIKWIKSNHDLEINKTPDIPILKVGIFWK